MPRPPVSGVGDLGERRVQHAALVDRHRAVGRRTQERVPEADLRADLDHIGIEVRGDPEPVGRSPHQRHVTLRVGGRERQQRAMVGGERFDLPAEAVLDGERSGHGEAAVRGHPARQLEQRERVAVGFGEEPVAHALVHPAGDGGRKQRACVLHVEAFERQLRQAGEKRLAGGEEERDRLGQQARGDELEHAGGGVVEPVEIVDQAKKRLLVGG